MTGIPIAPSDAERAHRIRETPSDASTGIPIPPPPVEIEPVEASRRPPWGWIIALLMMAVAGIAAVLAAVALWGDGDESANPSATEERATAEPAAEEADVAIDESVADFDDASFSLVTAAELDGEAEDRPPKQVRDHLNTKLDILRGTAQCYWRWRSTFGRNNCMAIKLNIDGDKYEIGDDLRSRI